MRNLKDQPFDFIFGGGGGGVFRGREATTAKNYPAK